MFRAVALVLTAVLAPPLAATGQAWEPFAQQAFDREMAAGKTIVLDCHASWCPICKAQRAILEPMLGEPEFAAVVGFIIDYDNASDAKREFDISKPSTLIVFRGTREVGRSTGVTDGKALRAFVRKGL